MRGGILTLILAIFVFLFISMAYAHLDSGSDDVVNGYFLDFGYSPKYLFADQGSFINLNILNYSNRKAINVSKVWVRITDNIQDNIVRNSNNPASNTPISNNIIIFTGELKPEDGNIGIYYTFPHSGEYTLLARFYKDSEIIVEKEYDLDVYDLDKSSSILITSAISLLLLIILLLIVKKINVSTHA